MTDGRLALTREQILEYRRRVGALDSRVPMSARALRQAAWAGLQDSVPRAALLAIHARVERAQPSSWEDPSLVQLWGPRFSVFVVAAEDLAVFSLGRLPDEAPRRERAEDLADRLDELLDGRRLPYAQAGRALGGHPNELRYAGATGRVLIRWDGARAPTVWTVPAPDVDPAAARLELARRFLHVVGPATSSRFAWWAGLAPRRGRDAFEALRSELTSVRTPSGDAWILAIDEHSVLDRSTVAGRAPAVRLLPSGDPYLMAGDRELLVPDPAQRRALWPPATVWPGGLMIDGDLVGTWRRASERMMITAWRPPTPVEREAVETEARDLPLPEIAGRVRVTWTE